MGTRSLTVLCDNDEEEIVVMYRQMDGYPSGHGLELAQFLSEFTIVNGISLSETRKIANGMDCLAAQVVAHFKHGAGGIYLCKAGTRNCGEDYVYTVKGSPGEQLTIECVNFNGETVFSGTAQDAVKEWGND